MNSLLNHDYMPFLQHEFKENTSILVVHVSSRNRKNGTFDKYPVPDIVSNLYINVCDKSWYLNGLPCFESGRDGTIGYLKDVIETNGFKRVIFVGSSMGAFGSYLFANDIENSEVIAFGPELILNVYSGYSNSDVATISYQPFFENYSRLKRCYIFAGLNQPSDVACALLASHKIGAKSYILKHIGHATAKFLKEKENLLAKLIDSVINDKLTIVSDLLKEYQISDELLRSLDPIVDFDFNETKLDVFVDTVKSHLNARDCIDLSHILYKRSPASCVKLLNDAKSRFGAIGEFDYLYAQALFHNRDYSNAKIILDKLKTNSFYQGAAFQLHIKILKREKNLNEALALSKYFESSLSNMINTVKNEIENLSQNTNEIEVKKNVDNSPEKIDYQLRINQLLQKNNLVADDYFQMIQAYRNLGNYEKAEDSAFRGIEKFPDHTKILSEWAWNAQVTKNWPEAIFRLEKLMSVLGENVSEKIFCRLVDTYNLVGEKAKAQKLVQKGLIKFPKGIKLLSRFESPVVLSE